MKEIKRTLTLLLCIVIFFSIAVVNENCVNAKSSKKAMKFLKGTWISVGESQSKRIIFTKKYMKTFSLWNDDYTRIYSPDKKGKYIGKRKIVSTKKKGKKWIIKVGKKGSYTYYKSANRNLLECYWKEDGIWMYSGSGSISRYK